MSTLRIRYIDVYILIIQNESAILHVHITHKYQYVQANNDFNAH